MSGQPNYGAQGYQWDPSAQAYGRTNPVPPIPTKTRGTDGQAIRTIPPYFISPAQSANPIDQVRDYSAWTMRQQQHLDKVGLQRNVELLYADAKQFDEYIQPEEVIGQSFTDERDRLTAVQPIYAPIQFVANAKFCDTPNGPKSRFNWTLNRLINNNSAGTISVTEDYFRKIVSVLMHPFYLPKSALSDNDIYYGTVSVNITTLIGADASSMDYYGPIVKPYGSPKTFTCKIDTTLSDALRYYLVPLNPRVVFVTPISATNNSWGIAFSTPVNPIITIQPIVFNAVVSVAANPVTLTLANHQLVNGEKISVDTEDLPSNYIATITLFNVNVLTSSTFQLTGFDGTNLTLGTSLLLTNHTRNFCINFSMTSINYKQSLADSNRGILQII